MKCDAAKVIELTFVNAPPDSLTCREPEPELAEQLNAPFVHWSALDPVQLVRPAPNNCDAEAKPPISKLADEEALVVIARRVVGEMVRMPSPPNVVALSVEASKTPETEPTLVVNWLKPVKVLLLPVILPPKVKALIVRVPVEADSVSVLRVEVSATEADTPVLKFQLPVIVSLALREAGPLTQSNLTMAFGAA